MVNEIQKKQFMNHELQYSVSVFLVCSNVFMHKKIVNCTSFST